jgi:hypothetical protein
VKQILIFLHLIFFGMAGKAQTPAPLLSYKDTFAVNSGLNWLSFSPATGISANMAQEEDRPQHPFQRREDDWRFYAAVLLVLLFGLLKTAFRKMYDQLVTLMFRSTVKSRQIKEQLQHTTIPSLAFNLLFIISGSLLLMLAVMHYAPEMRMNAFLLWLLCAGGIAAVYFVKFCWLKMTGWIFNEQESAGTYLFFVFFLNKILGIFLIPLIVLLLLSSSQTTEYLLIISYFLIGLFILYRYYLAYGAAQKAIKTSPFHFFLYICAVEITPLLLIYRGLFNFLAY